MESVWEQDSGMDFLYSEDDIPQDKRKQLVRRVKELVREGILKERDWVAIYDILLNACEREKARTVEQLLIAGLNKDY